MFAQLRLPVCVHTSCHSVHVIAGGVRTTMACDTQHGPFKCNAPYKKAMIDCIWHR